MTEPALPPKADGRALRRLSGQRLVRTNSGSASGGESTPRACEEAPSPTNSPRSGSQDGSESRTLSANTIVMRSLLEEVKQIGLRQKRMEEVVALYPGQLSQLYVKLEEMQVVQQPEEDACCCCGWFREYRAL
jgi:hypothetical protein